MLTERERWLVDKAFDAGLADYYVSAKFWLEDIAADGGVTVEMVLVKDAPNA